MCFTRQDIKYYITWTLSLDLAEAPTETAELLQTNEDFDHLLFFVQNLLIIPIPNL